MKGAGHIWGAGRWVTAGAIAVAAHFGGAWVAMNWSSPVEPPDNGPPPAVMIDLAPMPVAASDAPAADLAPGPQAAEALEAEQPLQSQVAMNEPPPEPEPAPEPEPVPELQAPESEKKAEVMLPPAPEVDQRKEREKQRRLERERQKRIQEARERRQKEREKERAARARARAREAARQATAQQNSAPSGRPGPVASAASSGAGARAALATWRGRLISHLNRYKRFPSGAGAGGVATVSFTINRNGAVVGARLARSSGDSVLDQEATAMLRRASPVPAPPPEIMKGATLSLSVPLKYSRQDTWR